jgi:lipopolysaccharide/colanic/teichoic acid biosynthesis glycosyltransferase
MSVVGPRPEWVGSRKGSRGKSAGSGQTWRHGLSRLARRPITFQADKLDLYYLTPGFFLDVFIMLKTILVVSREWD